MLPIEDQLILSSLAREDALHRRWTSHAVPTQRRHYLAAYLAALRDCLPPCPRCHKLPAVTDDVWEHAPHKVEIWCVNCNDGDRTFASDVMCGESPLNATEMWRDYVQDFFE